MEDRFQNTNPIQSRPSVHVSRPSNFDSRPAANQPANPSTVITQFLQNQPPAAPAPLPAAIATAPSASPLVSHHSQPMIADSNDQPASKPPLRKHLTAVFSVLAILAFASSGVMLLGGSKADVQKSTKPLSIANPADLKSSPSERPITSDSFAAFRTAPELARFMTISNLNIKARVTELGAKANNTLMPPGSIYDVAWFNGSAKPGQKGATVIEGFDQGPTKSGVFAKIDNLKAGDKIQLQTGSGVKIKYKVVKTQTLDVKSVNLASLLKPISGEKGLNLVTCSGSAENNNQRTIVFATQIS